MQFRCSRSRWLATILVGMAGYLSLSAPSVLARADNPPQSDVIGPIEGDAISVQGPMTVDTTNGQVKTILLSGSEVVVKAGQAHIDLVDGGNITICGPARLSVLKSAGALTVALDSGTIHARIEGQLNLTIFTAQIQAHTVAIGGGPQDTLVGLDASGAMCIHASKGAVRIEQQLTGQSLLIPQNGDVSLTNGQLETLKTTAGQCKCELLSPAFSTQVSALASTEDLKKAAAAKPAADPKPSDPSPQTDEPIYQVVMPPLRYDAKAKVQQDYDPSLIVLVRRARVRPALVFQGKVEGDPAVAQATPAPPPPNTRKPEGAKKDADDSTWTRLRTFFQKLWSPSS